MPTISLGASVYDTISAGGQHDGFTVDLVAGQAYEFRLHGVGTGELRDTYLRLYNPSSTLVAYNDDFQWGQAELYDSRVVYTAELTGTYTIDVSGYNVSYTGDYLLTAVQANPAGMVFTNDEIAWQLVTNGLAYFGRPPVSFNVGADNALTVNLTALTSDGQYLARQALQAWTNVTGITFQEVPGGAEIGFDDSAAGITAYTNWATTGATLTSANVMITSGWLTYFGTSLNSYSFETYIHEIGHALGLGHGGNYNGSATYGVDNYYLNDSLAYTIMSYMNAHDDEFGGPNTFVDASFRYMYTPQMADIVAIQYLYGDRGIHFNGNTTYGFNSNTGVTALDNAVNAGASMAFTIFDEGGIDTLNFYNYGGSQTLNLNSESFSNVLGGVMNLATARNVVIENAIGGSGNDAIHLSSLNVNNVINGGGGSDTVYVTYSSGAGYAVQLGSAATNLVMTGAAGTDTLQNVEYVHFADGVTATTASLVPDDYAGNATTTGVVAVGGSITGNLEVSGDHDWFGVQLNAGTTYTIQLQGSDHNAGTLNDPYLRLYDSSSTLVAQNDDFGGSRDSLLSFTPATSGTYYIDAGAHNDGGAGAYTVSVVGGGHFAAPTLGLDNFTTGAGGWSSRTTYPRELADVNGDGRADIVGFGGAGVYVSQATGDGHFGALTFELANFATGSGWNSNTTYPREVADVNGDGRADIVGFGGAGVYVSLATGNGHYAALTFELADFATGVNGWSNDTTHPRELADVNGDGRADIVGFGGAGVYVALATGGGHFAAPSLELTNFTAGAGGWSSDTTYPRELGDVNGDGRADIVGFGGAGVYVALATGGGHFADPTFELANFATGVNGWSNDTTHPRELADVNGDGRADIVGFGGAGVYVALATGGGHFADPTFELADFATGAGGWSNDTTHPRELADVNGDGRADIVGFGHAGGYSSLSNFLLS